jgi:hypothetical protein
VRGALPAGATLLGWPNYGVDGRLNKLSENNNFDVKTVRKFLILREKKNI